MSCTSHVPTSARHPQVVLSLSCHATCFMFGRLGQMLVSSPILPPLVCSPRPWTSHLPPRTLEFLCGHKLLSPNFPFPLRPQCPQQGRKALRVWTETPKAVVLAVGWCMWPACATLTAGHRTSRVGLGSEAWQLHSLSLTLSSAPSDCGLLIGPHCRFLLGSQLNRGQQQ